MPLTIPAIRAPETSLTESAPGMRPRSGLAAVSYALGRTWLMQGRLPLDVRLRRIKARKRHVLAMEAPASCNDSLLSVARTFLHYRSRIPLRSVCLLDSLALLELLAWRGEHPDLVIGVMMEPFGAHCWVQAGEMVLNDDLGHALQFTPIVVI